MACFSYCHGERAIVRLDRKGNREPWLVAAKEVVTVTSDRDATNGVLGRTVCGTSAAKYHLTYAPLALTSSMHSFFSFLVLVEPWVFRKHHVNARSVSDDQEPRRWNDPHQVQPHRTFYNTGRVLGGLTQRRSLLHPRLDTVRKTRVISMHSPLRRKLVYLML